MKLWLAVLASVCMTLAAVSCGESEPEPPPPPDVPTILEMTGEAMQNLSTFTVVLKHDGGTTEFAPGIVLSEAEANIVNPDRMSAKFKASFGTMFVDAEFVAVGEENWLTNPLNQKWESIPTEVSPLGFFNPRRGIIAILADVHSVEEPPKIDGNLVTLNGSVPAKTLESLLGKSIEGATVAVELIIDLDTYYLMETTIDGRVAPSDAEGIVRFLWLSRFNEPMTVEPPEVE